MHDIDAPLSFLCYWHCLSFVMTWMRHETKTPLPSQPFVRSSYAIMCADAKRETAGGDDIKPSTQWLWIIKVEKCLREIYVNTKYIRSFFSSFDNVYVRANDVHVLLLQWKTTKQQAYRTTQWRQQRRHTWGTNSIDQRTKEERFKRKSYKLFRCQVSALRTSVGRQREYEKQRNIIFYDSPKYRRTGTQTLCGTIDRAFDI